MKFQVAQSKLLAALKLSQSVTSTRTTLPILGNVLIKCNGSAVHMTTTDLDVALRCETAASIKKSGATTLPARRLLQIVGELPSGDINFDVDSKDVVSIEHGNCFFKILGLPEQEFPPFPDFSNAKVYSITQADLKNALTRVHYAMSTDETRYVLNGAYFLFQENGLTIVSTDGRRLATVEIPMSISANDARRVIVPSKAIFALLRLLDGTDNVEVKLNDSQVSFELNGRFLASKLIEGNYPNYNQVIPKESPIRLTLNREALQKTIHRVALLTSEKSSSLRLSLEKNSLTISALTPEVGEAKETVDVKYSGVAFSIGFNPAFILEPLKNLTEDEVHLDLIDEMSPGVLRTDTADGQPKFLYVLMPMRLS